MIFEIGKFYKHSSGKKAAIICLAIQTTQWGNCLVAEVVQENYPTVLVPFGNDQGAAQYWKEITKEEWLESFENEKIETKRKTR